MVRIFFGSFVVVEMLHLFETFCLFFFCLVHHFCSINKKMSEVKGLVKGYRNIKRKPYKLRDILSQLLFDICYHLVHIVNRFSLKLCLCHIYQGYLKKTRCRGPKKDFCCVCKFKINIFLH